MSSQNLSYFWNVLSESTKISLPNFGPFADHLEETLCKGLDVPKCKRGFTPQNLFFRKTGVAFQWNPYKVSHFVENSPNYCILNYKILFRKSHDSEMPINAGLGPS